MERATGRGGSGSRMGWILGVGLLVLGISAGVAHSGSPDADSRSLQVYPEQQIPFTFNHKLHLEQGAQCQLCHASTATSTSAQDHNIPNHATCGICHQMQLPGAADLYPKAACSTCHNGFSEGLPEHVGPDKAPLADAPKPAALVFPPARITFSHKKHLDQGVPCLTCHEGVDKTALATRQHLPSMATCLTCHDGGKAPSECTTCHLQTDGGRVLTDFAEAGLLTPGGRFRPDDHDSPRWLHQHRVAAKVDEASCSFCHEANDCLACHDGTQKVPGLHPADWVMSHGLEAQRRTLDCQACHEVETDCKSCHEAAGVVRGAFPGGPGAPEDRGIRFHPEGWAGTVGEIPGAEHHSHIARRSLDTCASCHGGADADLCIECHGSIVNPHPPSWSDPDYTGNFGGGEGGVCLRCHSPGDPVLDRMVR